MVRDDETPPRAPPPPDATHGHPARGVATAAAPNRRAQGLPSAEGGAITSAPFRTPRSIPRRHPFGHRQGQPLRPQIAVTSSTAPCVRIGAMP